MLRRCNPLPINKGGAQTVFCKSYGVKRRILSQDMVNKSRRSMERSQIVSGLQANKESGASSLSHHSMESSINAM